MLTAGARTEVLARNQYAAGIRWVVQHKVLIRRAIGVVSPIAEQVVAKEFLLAGRSLKETGGYYLVCVHIL